MASITLYSKLLNLESSRKSMVEEYDELDSPWKEILERYFLDFMSFFFPYAYQDIDWTKGYEFLDKELQQVVRDAELGKRLVDKLVKVWRKDGKETWVLIHIEIQGQRKSNFNLRMYVYNYRLFDRYHKQVASFAILCDDNINWKPTEYSYDLWGSRASLKFVSIKLSEYEQYWADLEQSDNKFAIVVMAYLKSRSTKKDADERLKWKLILFRMLYQKGYNRKDILELVRFIDWVIVLPQELAEKFDIEIKDYEETHMPYITSFERHGMEKGLGQGLREGILNILVVRFETISQQTTEKLNNIKDPTQLRELHTKSLKVASLTEFEELLS